MGDHHNILRIQIRALHDFFVCINVKAIQTQEWTNPKCRAGYGSCPEHIPAGGHSPDIKDSAMIPDCVLYTVRSFTNLDRIIQHIVGALSDTFYIRRNRHPGLSIR